MPRFVREVDGGSKKRGMLEMGTGRTKSVHAEVTRTLAAPADRVYAILADYRSGHPRILPKGIEELTVEEGGHGAGTVIRFGLRSFGILRWVRAAVDEPEPGRVLVERILDDPVVETAFTVERIGPDRSSVRIETTWTPEGHRGLIERLLGPLMLRRAYAEELTKLEEVARGEP